MSLGVVCMNVWDVWMYVCITTYDELAVRFFCSTTRSVTPYYT